MSTFDYDVIVVGAGINGVGVAQAAAAAGHRVLIMDKSGPAAGTSSKSSKLIHGGLRYLESLELGLVRESLRERALLLKLAPELVQLQEFRIPVYAGARRSPLILRTGLSLYWLLSGLAPEGRFSALPRSRWEQLDGLVTHNLRAVFSYSDGRTDDAMLTRAVLASASGFDTTVAFPAEFISAEIFPGGARVNYRTAGEELSATARVLVNAGGPWVNEILERVEPQPECLPVSLVQGTHIELQTGIDGMSGAFYYLESPRDGRAVFVMPRGERLIVGTTETRHRQPADLAGPLPAEESYLLSVLCHYFPQFAAVNRTDIAASWAGLRVLPGGDAHAFHKSRETILATDRAAKPRVLSIYGGKLTTYRTTALKVMEKLASSLPSREPLASTAELPLRPPG